MFDAQKSIRIQRQLSVELKCHDSGIFKNAIARMKSRVPQESDPQSEIASPVFQRGRNDIRVSMIWIKSLGPDRRAA